MAGRSGVRGSWMGRLLLGSALLVAIAAAAVVGGGLWVRHAMTASLPQVDGELRVAGLAGAVTVARDGQGVPHIRAASLDDLFLAQGYVTAQDRLWQMDMTRRYVAGELAELLGKTALEHDRVQRLLLMRPTAERIAAGLSARDRRYFEDYARGVNAFAAESAGHLPAEFRVLAYKPRAWTVTDSILVLLGMVQMEDERWENKLNRERVLARLGPTLAEDLYPLGSWRDHPPVPQAPDLTAPQEAIPDVPLDESQSELRGLGNDGADLARLNELLGHHRCEDCGVGSNEWAVSGAHTVSGKPLMSNDMHITHTIPNVWYEVELNAEGFHAAGVTTPGAPFVVSGHNEHVSWGFTSLYGDTQDLVLERVDGRGSYLRDGKWKAFEHVAETIKVRGGKDVAVDVRKTDWGPVISQAIAGEGRVVTLRWSAYDGASAGIPLFDMNVAGDWAGFRTALGRWWGPTLNVIYADDAGHIGYQAVGYVPVRQGGLSGVPAAAGTHLWTGMVPFEALPTAFDPPGGILATANARVTPDGYPYPLTLEWAAPYRNERIWKWLEGKAKAGKLGREEMLALQTDVYSALDVEVARQYAYAIDHTAGASSQLKKAADLLRSWDGVVGKDSAAAAIVLATRKAIWPMLLKPHLGEDWVLYQWGEKLYAEEELVTHKPARWLPPGYANWDAFLAAAVEAGLEAEKAPAKLEKWKYGEIRSVGLAHPLYSMIPWFKDWTGTGKWPLSGDSSTVKQMNGSLGPSQRLTVDWSDLDESTENIVLGQSGNPMSPWYRDQWAAWYGGTTFALPFSDGAVAKAAKHTLRLMP